MAHPVWKIAWQYLLQLNICIPYDLALLGIYPKELTTKAQSICMPLFIAAFFTTAKREKQPKCLSMHEQLNKLWYIHTVE